MTIATLKDFEITNIEEDYYTGREFNGTWADNTCELCDVTITMDYNEKRYELTIKPADPGAYGSYGGDRSRGKGISTEILIDIIQQLTDEPDELTFENFVNNHFHEYGYRHEVKLKNSKEKYYLAKPINLVTEPKTVKNSCRSIHMSNSHQKTSPKLWARISSKLVLTPLTKCSKNSVQKTNMNKKKDLFSSFG